MLQSPFAQSTAGPFERVGAAGRKLKEIVVLTPGMLSQYLITILLRDGSSQRWNCTTQFLYVLLIVRSTSGVETPMSSGHSYLPLDRGLPLQEDDMIDDIGEECEDDAEMCTWIKRASRQRKQASRRLKGCFEAGLAHSSDTLKSSEWVPFASLPIICRVLSRLWIGLG